MPSNEDSELPGEFTEAKGALIAVDTALFFTILNYLVENDLLDSFSQYLGGQEQRQILLDAATANHLKRFLVTKRLTDTKAKMVIRSSCGGGGGGGGPVAGVRG